MLYHGFYPAKILSYTAGSRSAQIHVEGLTNGAEDGIAATFAYPVGDDDKDTERLIVAGADVYIFFDQGDIASPVIAFFRSHGVGAVIDVRRIRQKNIEVLATQNITLQAVDTIVVHGENVVINANSSVLINSPMTTIDGNAEITGNVAFGGAVINNGVNIGDTHKHPAKPPSSPADFSGTAV